MGHSYSFVGKNELSILYYDTAINLNNQKDIAFFERGISYFLSGNSRKALDDINTAILINSENANYLINRGTIYYDLGTFDSACNDRQNALNMDDDLIDYSIIETNCNKSFFLKSPFFIALINFTQANGFSKGFDGS